MKENNHVHIIGGGIIGLCSAYYLHKAGYTVTVIDQGDFTQGCSHGNSGMIVPSHFVPLAAPGVIAKGIGWLFSASSPLYIRPRLDLALLQWLWQFYRASNAERAAKAMPILRDYHQLSKSLYETLRTDLGDFHYTAGGLLMLYRTAHGGAEEIAMAEKAHTLGIEAIPMSATELNTIETGTRLTVQGGVYYPGDAHLYPNRLLEKLISYLQQQGVQLLSNGTVTDIHTHNGQITALGLDQQQTLPVEQLVLAAGSWSPRIAKMLGLRLLLQDGKGYSLTLPAQTDKPNIPAILVEDKVAITPMANDLRIGGTLEISGMRAGVDMARLQGILTAIPRYYPTIQPSMPDIQQVWSGFRPCSPDGLPYVGRSDRWPNLIFATGHAMMGLSLGPATGQLIQQIVSQQPTSIPIDLFRAERFG